MIQTCWGWASLTGHRLSQEGSQGSTMVMYIPQNDRNPIELFEFYYEKAWTFSPSIREICVWLASLIWTPFLHFWSLNYIHPMSGDGKSCNQSGIYIPMISLDSHQMSWITIAFFQYITYHRLSLSHDIPTRYSHCATGFSCESHWYSDRVPFIIHSHYPLVN